MSLPVATNCLLHSPPCSSHELSSCLLSTFFGVLQNLVV